MSSNEDQVKIGKRHPAPVKKPLPKPLPPKTVAPKQAPVAPTYQSIDDKNLEWGPVLMESELGGVHAGTWLGSRVNINLARVPDFESFIRELQQLQHPNFVHLYGVCVKPKLCLVTEAAMPLHDYLSSNQCGLEKKLALATDMARGLFYLQSKNVMYRDLRPETLLVTPAGQAKLTHSGLTNTVDLSDNMGWIAPELFDTDANHTPASVAYSFGTVLWFLFSQVKPLQLKNGIQESIPCDLPEEIALLIKQCWSVDPAERPAWKSLVECVVSCDPKKSLTLQALYDLGQEYEKQKEYENAFAAYSRSAEGGYDRGQTCLATLLIQGKGCEKNLKEAFHWMLESARQNKHARAQYNVAKMYENGHGTEQDIRAAIYWYKKAEKNKSKEAKEALARYFPIPEDRLEFGKELGEGGFAKVHSAFWNPIDGCRIPVAIKTVKENASSLAKSQFKKEGELQANFDSSGIVIVYGFKEKLPLGIVMELVPQGTLYDVLRSKTQTTFHWTARVKMVMGMVNGVMYLHSQTPIIIHSDLKSLNVLVTENDETKLADFGCAVSKFDTEQMYGDGNAPHQGPRGTLCWMAPEIIAGEPRTRASDIYSVGSIFGEVALLQLPYADFMGNEGLIRERVLAGHREELGEEVPQGYAVLTESCWDQNPKKRPTAKTVQVKLEKLHSQLLLAPTLFPTVTKSLPTRSERRLTMNRCLMNTGNDESECLPNSLLVDSFLN